MSKLVQVSLLDPVRRDDLVLVPIRWEATGLMGGLFPVLDANLILDRDDQGHAVLRITGVYRPPLDGLGEELDELVLHPVASATLSRCCGRLPTVWPRRWPGPLAVTHIRAVQRERRAPGGHAAVLRDQRPWWRCLHRTTLEPWPPSMGR